MKKNKRFNKIYIEITNICNLKCSFCPDTIRKKEFMSIDKFKMIIDKVKGYAGIITLHVKGEPLIHPQLDEILEYCSVQNVKVNITTNGTKLNEVKNILCKDSVRQINISIHSINKNSNMDNDKYLENIFQAVRYIKEKNSSIYISYRLWNLKDITKNDENYNVLKFLGQKYEKNDLIEQVKSNLYVELDKNVFLNQDIVFQWPDLNQSKKNEKGSCLGLRSQLAILVNGDVVPCCMDQNGDIILGKIFEEDLEDILNKKIAKEIIKGFEENRLICELCQKCGYREKFNK